GRARGLCYTCGSPGHYQAQCPKKRKSGNSRERCQLCNGMGHNAKQCRKRDGNQGQRPGKGL
nr:Chain A, Nucleocapsid (NC) Protein [Rous sarcoma virus]